MIELRSVHKTYTGKNHPRVDAVAGVSLAVAEGEFLIITGRSGSGKTTLLNLIAGLTVPSSGKVFIDGLDLWSLPDRRQSLLRHQKFGFIFQFPSLLPSLSILENTVLPLGFGNHAGDEGRERAAALLGQVGLSEKLTAFPRQLSAGQQQRAVIARALIASPSILLADEPTSDLDEQTEEEIMQLFSQLHRSSGITIVLVTHASQLVQYGTRWLKMAAGREIV